MSEFVLPGNISTENTPDNINQQIYLFPCGYSAIRNIYDAIHMGGMLVAAVFFLLLAYTFSILISLFINRKITDKK